MTRWVMGALVGALVVAPVGFGGLTHDLAETVARMLFAVLLTAAVVFLGLGAVWTRRWAV